MIRLNITFQTLAALREVRISLDPAEGIHVCDGTPSVLATVGELNGELI
jgi:hypothetical protein